MATARDRSALRDWAAQAGLVFRGTVRRENAATMAMVPPDAGTAVVLVDEVLKAPQALSGIAGKEITLLPAEGGSAKAGQSAVFFTRSWLYGGSLAVIEVGRLRLHTTLTPGHTPGSMCFRIEGSPVLLAGDTLFPGGPGNTSFEGGDFDTIIRSIDDRLFSKLPDDTIVMPGHGDDTTIGAERPHLQEWVDRGW